MQNTIDVGLVGATPNGADCLGLQYLATSLKIADHRPRLIVFYGIGDIEKVVEEVVAYHPPLLGVSILSGIAAIDALAFILRVRQRGYTGHLTCGGPYATLCRHMLLQKYTQIDSVVRHDGEVPIRMLADAIA